MMYKIGDVVIINNDRGYYTHCTNFWLSNKLLQKYTAAVIESELGEGSYGCVIALKGASSDIFADPYNWQDDVEVFEDDIIGVLKDDTKVKFRIGGMHIGEGVYNKGIIYEGTDKFDVTYLASDQHKIRIVALDDYPITTKHTFINNDQSDLLDRIYDILR